MSSSRRRVTYHTRIPTARTTAEYAKVYIGDLRKVTEKKHPRENSIEGRNDPLESVRRWQSEGEIGLHGGTGSWSSPAIPKVAWRNGFVQRSTCVV